MNHSFAPLLGAHSTALATFRSPEPHLRNGGIGIEIRAQVGDRLPEPRREPQRGRHRPFGALWIADYGAESSCPCASGAQNHTRVRI